jgi:hypothetical protein
MSIAYTGKMGLVAQVKFLKLPSVNVIRCLSDKKSTGFYLS